MCCAPSPRHNLWADPVFVKQLDTQRFVEAAGNFYIGLGDQFNSDKLNAYRPASVTAVGPLSLEYMNSKDGLKI